MAEREGEHREYDGRSGSSGSVAPRVQAVAKRVPQALQVLQRSAGAGFVACTRVLAPASFGWLGHGWRENIDYGLAARKTLGCQGESAAERFLSEAVTALDCAVAAGHIIE